MTQPWREYILLVILLCYFGPGTLIVMLVLYVKEKIDQRQRPSWSEHGAGASFEVIVKPGPKRRRRRRAKRLRHDLLK